MAPWLISKLKVGGGGGGGGGSGGNAGHCISAILGVGMI